jgi:hypothetical protein
VRITCKISVITFAAWLLTGIPALCGAQPPPLEIYGVPPIHKLTREEAPGAEWLKGKAVLSCARNESESFQVVVRARELEDGLAVAVGEMHGPNGALIPTGAFRVHRVEWVDINAPVRPDEPSTNPDFQPDPLPPVDPANDVFTVEPGKNLVFWVTVAVRDEMRPGSYHGEIKIHRQSSAAAALALELNVRRFALPRRPILQSLIGLADGNIYRAHGCKTPEEKEKVIRLFLEEYIRARLSPFLYAPGTMAFNPLPGGAIRWRFVKGGDGEPTGEVKLDFTGFDREGEYYLDQREAFSAFNFAPYLEAAGGPFGKQERVLRFSDGNGTVIESRNADGSLNPVFDQAVTAVFRGIAGNLGEKGWLDRAIYYVADEPASDDAPALKEICELVRRADPRIRTALTYDPASRTRLAELEENGRSLISVWIPYCTDYKEDVASDQRSKGADYWLYDISTTALISSSGQTNRSIFWDVWRRNASGYLYYLATWWGREATPWERPNFVLPGINYRYRHGNGYFFYPPLKRGDPERPILDHVVPSIRWELMREGAEDYDYLRMLEGLVSRAERQNLPAAAQGREALAAARVLAEAIGGVSSSYEIHDLKFKQTPGWSAALDQGFLINEGGKRTDLPIEVQTMLPDGPYELSLLAYDDSGYRGRPYSRFLLDGRPYATAASSLKSAVDVSAGLVQVRERKCAFTLSSVDENFGVIIYRIRFKRAIQDAPGLLYGTRATVAEAIESLQTALEEG